MADRRRRPLAGARVLVQGPFLRRAAHDSRAEAVPAAEADDLYGRGVADREGPDRFSQQRACREPHPGRTRGDRGAYPRPEPHDAFSRHAEKGWRGAPGLPAGYRYADHGKRRGKNNDQGGGVLPGAAAHLDRAQAGRRHPHPGHREGSSRHAALDFCAACFRGSLVHFLDRRATARVSRSHRHDEDARSAHRRRPTSLHGQPALFQGPAGVAARAKSEDAR